ncbi:hypothetical protein ACFOGQ_14980 [Acinetobacter vivianii]
MVDIGGPYRALDFWGAITMIKVMVVGQKWLAEQILLLCMDESYEVAAVAPPSHDDRLAKTAKGFDIPVRIAPKRLDAKDVPDDIDLILCAHTHCYIAAEARQKCKLGAIGFHPSLLPSYKGKMRFKMPSMRVKMKQEEVYFYLMTAGIRDKSYFSKLV